MNTVISHHARYSFVSNFPFSLFFSFLFFSFLLQHVTFSLSSSLFPFLCHLSPPFLLLRRVMLAQIPLSGAV